MKISLRNIGLIGKADVDISGITVIAGKNNTGKSTVAKSLYSVFKAFYNIDDKIEKDKTENMRNIAKWYARRLKEDSYICEKINTIGYFFIDETDFKEQIESIETNDNFENISKEESRIWNRYKKDMLEILKISNDKRKHKIISRYISGEFDGQMNNIYTKQEGYIDIKLKKKTIKILLIEDNIIIDREETLITEDATYIENISLINIIDDFWLYGEYNHDYDLISKILPKRKTIRRLSIDEEIEDIEAEQSNDNISKEIINEEKLENIYKRINGVVDGNIIHSNTRSIVYKLKNGDEFNIKNVSAGLKTFIIIKELLMRDKVQKNGVLILDEPEIHLHPELQLTFAELIVLLQKEFNLHILLNTHSPYFLKAIEVYSKKHNISDKCKYYLTNDSNENSIIVDDVTDKTYEIYRLLAEPYNELHEIEREI